MTTGQDEVLRLLAASDPEGRRHGAQRIPELQGEAATTLLVQALGDADWRVRKEAALVAQSVLPRASVTARLIVALDDRNNVGLRNAAVEALILLGSDAVPVTIRALDELDADARKLAVEVLAGVPDLAGIRALARTLNDEDVNVRASAAEALGSASLAGVEAREVAIAALTDALVADEPLRRLAALTSLRRLDARIPWRVFEPLARDPLLRRHAIAAAARAHEVSAVAALAEAIADPSPVVARDAVVALVECLSTHGGTEDLKAIARQEILGLPLAESRLRALATTTEDPEVRGAALMALGLLRVRADVATLVRGLSDEEVAPQAELGLRWFGQEAVPALVEEGRRASTSVRAETLSLISLVTDRADEATLVTLRDALTSEAPEVQTAAIQAIAAMGTGTDLAFLAPHATSTDARVAATACAALASLASRHQVEARAMAESIPPDSPLAVVGCLLRGASAGQRHVTPSGGRTIEAVDVPFLRSALDHDDVRVRRAAVDALSAIGGSRAAAVVARALADEERDVVLAAVRALGRMGQADPLKALLEGVHDTSLVASALRALGEANPTEALGAAWRFLQSSDALLASAAVETLGQLRDPRREEGLALALGHGDPGVVKTALSELSREPSRESIIHIGRCLDSASYEVRKFAAELLAGVEGDAAHALIRARLDRETDRGVREALTQALVRHAPKREP